MAFVNKCRLSLQLALIILTGPVILLIGCKGEAFVDALKITVSSNGLYAIDERELKEAGLGFDTFTTDKLSLTQDGIAIPFLLKDGKFIFYGLGPDGRYSSVRSYVLRANQVGEAIATRQMPASSGTHLSKVPQSLHLEENYLYASDIPTTEPAGPWFWETIQDQTEITFAVPAIADGSGELRLNLYGTTHNPQAAPDHSLALLINGIQLSELTWEGQSYFTSTETLPPGSLQLGENKISLVNIPEDYLDFSNLNWIALTYLAPPSAHDDQLALQDVAGTVTLTGFSDKPIVLDVSQPTQPVELTGWQYGKEGALLNLTDAMQVVAVGPNGFKTPENVQVFRDNAGWADPAHQADLLIITTDDLAPGLVPLAEAREAEGMTVVTVPVEEIYDEFGEGEISPDSIRSFIRHTQKSWSEPAPKYVFVVGDATTDYRSFLASRPEDPISPPTNIVPSYLVPVSFSGETVSDARLVDLNDDLTPDLAIGRWPVADLDQVKQLVARTLAYETGIADDRALFATDGTSGEFSQLVGRLLIGSDFPGSQAELLYGAQAGQVAETWNKGAWLVMYTGHGSLQLWGKDEVFSVDTVGQLAENGSPPIVLQLTCLSGLFAHPEISSLSETLLKHEAGPVLLIGATSLTYSRDQEPFASEFLIALQDPDMERIGDVFQVAKTSLAGREQPGLREVSDTFTLFGDPSARVLRPAASIPNISG